jgi:hypothetical protein
VSVLQDTVNCKEQEGAADANHWRWLKSVIETLGRDGMSSEESESESSGTEVTYRPRTMKWRRPIEDELRLIDDEHRRLRSTQSRRGAKLVTRSRRLNRVVSTREPLPGLPRSFYNIDWLVTKSDLYVERTLQVSEEDFEWRSLFLL